ncbi:phosphonate metabolism protein/1,5-bisphosphokinase (PRPP-forming) PhnN [Metapseudomonas otitidis]|uniref:phosphonate metabolism protein/1,5-bisphosphokinase (PRPP-forming) PhnN n=1 Tax=Metapseudomonas otitidis TaxID=319939 RepID=UPI00366E6776
MNGRLFYLIGPSGSGKDSLLDAARPQLAERSCRVVRRVITRSAEAVGEAAEAVTSQRFNELEAQGAFAMSWHANGLSYGIPREIDDWLGNGLNVLVNGSRGYLPEARRRYPQLQAILLDVAPDVLRQRLLRRGRETADEIEARLARNAAFTQALLAEESEGLVILDNSGDLQTTLERLLTILGSAD